MRILAIAFICFSLAGCGGSSDSVSTTQPSVPSPVQPTQPTQPAQPTQPGEPSGTSNVDVEALLARPSVQDSARLLTQATFGATLNELVYTSEFLQTHSVADWVAEQANQPITLHHPVAERLGVVVADRPGAFGRPFRMEAWWRASLLGQDQLRQRLAFVYSQLFVISENSQLENFNIDLAAYYDLLVTHAFANYRDTLEAVTTSPAMGLYLSMLGNEKPNPELNIRPDENFAREIMQLFTLGLERMALDGTLLLDAQMQPIPTYNQENIEAYAHVFTGWHFANKPPSTWEAIFFAFDFVNPMEPVAEFHDASAKSLLNGYEVPANIGAEAALDIALDSLFYDANLPPFVAKHFIKQLVTSNPSSAYVERVASTFVDNGAGVRGDMLAVITAVLSDAEARSLESAQQDSFGKVKQPLLKATQLIRATMGSDIDIPDNRAVFQSVRTIQDYTAMAPLAAPSVFNFFLPDHQPNGELASLGLLAPEMQMQTSNTVIKNNNFVDYYLNSGDTDSLREWLQFSQSPLLNVEDTQRIEVMNFLLLQGHLNEAEQGVIASYADGLSGMPYMQQQKELVALIATSPQFTVQL